MKLIVKLSALFLLLTSINACSTLQSTAASKGSGTSRVYDKPYDVVWKKTLNTTLNASLNIALQDKEKGQILAEKGFTILSFGEKVAIFVEKDKNSKNKTRVEIISKRAFAGSVFAPNWENRLFRELDLEMNR